MSKYLLLIFPAVLIALFFFSQTFPTREIEKNIQMQVQQGPVVDISKAIKQKWTQMAVFGPYTSCQYANETIEQSYFDCSEGGFELEASDSSNLLVIMNGNKVVQVEEVSRVNDFDDNVRGKLILKKDALFTVSENGRKLSLKSN